MWILQGRGFQAERMANSKFLWPKQSEWRDGVGDEVREGAGAKSCSFLYAKVSTLAFSLTGCHWRDMSRELTRSALGYNRITLADVLGINF